MDTRLRLRLRRSDVPSSAARSLRFQIMLALRRAAISSAATAGHRNQSCGRELLIRLVTLAEDQTMSSGSASSSAGPDRASPVDFAKHRGAAATGPTRPARQCGRVLAARIVGGDDRDIGSRRSRPIGSRLSGSRSPAEPATAITRPVAISGPWQSKSNCVRRVGIVDDDGEAELVGHLLEPAWHGRHCLDAGDYRLSGTPSGAPLPPPRGRSLR